LPHCLIAFGKQDVENLLSGETRPVVIAGLSIQNLALLGDQRMPLVHWGRRMVAEVNGHRARQRDALRLPFFQHMGQVPSAIELELDHAFWTTKVKGDLNTMHPIVFTGD
jgi:hypothetical protein